VCPKSVLIADDDHALVQALALRVQGLGLRVQVAHDALSALNAVHASPPNLIILDVNMPAGSGLSVCEMLASDAHLSTIPVIILTGREDPVTIRRCHDLLAYYVLKCPDVWRRIEPVLHELLDLLPAPSSPFARRAHCAPVSPFAPQP
jgi:CheY-like chemotaxis protein